MSGSTTICPKCGQSDSIHRIWCRSCGEPLSIPQQPPIVVPDHSLEERKQLYAAILKDLNELSKHRSVDLGTVDAIKAFYEDQCAQIEEQQAEQNRAQRVHDLVVTAREAAHVGRFEHAIRYFQKCLADDHGEHELDQAIAEVRARSEQREQLLQAVRQAEVLLNESIACLAALRLEEAQSKLEQAKLLDPSNQRISEVLIRVKTQIAEQTAVEIAVPSLDGQEPILVAELAAQPIPPVVLSSTGPLEAITGPQPIAHRVEPVEAAFIEDREEMPSPMARLIESASQWSTIAKPFLLDNVGWFVGAFLVIAGFVVLIVSFWGSIEQNRILMHSLVYVSLSAATGTFFAAAYFIRLKYPQLESSSNVLLVIVALLIPLVFVSAMLTSLVPAVVPEATLLHNSLQNPG